MDKFAERIKELRNKRELSQEELGTIVGLGKQAVSSWERNESKPRSDTLHQLADYFNVSTDYILGRTDDPGNFTGEYTSNCCKERDGYDKYLQYSVAIDAAKEHNMTPKELEYLIKLSQSIKKSDIKKL